MNWTPPCQSLAVASVHVADCFLVRPDRKAAIAPRNSRAKAHARAQLTAHEATEETATAAKAIPGLEDRAIEGWHHGITNTFRFNGRPTTAKRLQSDNKQTC